MCPHGDERSAQHVPVGSQLSLHARESQLRISQLQFLLAEIDTWSGLLPAHLITSLHRRYSERLADLQAGMAVPPEAPSRGLPPTGEARPDPDSGLGGLDVV